MQHDENVMYVTHPNRPCWKCLDSRRPRNDVEIPELDTDERVVYTTLLHAYRDASGSPWSRSAEPTSGRIVANVRGKFNTVGACALESERIGEGNLKNSARRADDVEKLIEPPLSCSSDFPCTERVIGSVSVLRSYTYGALAV